MGLKMSSSYTSKASLVYLIYNLLVPFDLPIITSQSVTFCGSVCPSQSKSLLHVTITFSGLTITMQARRKSEELKSELSDSSKRNSIAADPGSKRSSLFSPESDGGESPRKLSLKSSAQAVRFMNKSKQLVRLG